MSNLQKEFNKYLSGAYPIVETKEGEIYIEPSEDGTKIIYGTLCNAGIIPQGEIAYDPTVSMDWHMQKLVEEVMNEYGWPE